jgi:hypothetical protein
MMGLPLMLQWLFAGWLIHMNDKKNTLADMMRQLFPVHLQGWTKSFVYGYVWIVPKMQILFSYVMLLLVGFLCITEALIQAEPILDLLTWSFVVCIGLRGLRWVRGPLTLISYIVSLAVLKVILQDMVAEWFPIANTVPVRFTLFSVWIQHQSAILLLWGVTSVPWMSCAMAEAARQQTRSAMTVSWGKFLSYGAIMPVLISLGFLEMPKAMIAVRMPLSLLWVVLGLGFLLILRVRTTFLPQGWRLTTGNYKTVAHFFLLSVMAYYCWNMAIIWGFLMIGSILLLPWFIGWLRYFMCGFKGLRGAF